MEDKIPYTERLWVKRRNRLEQMIDVIIACQEPIRTTNILGKTRLNHDMIRTIISKLCEVRLMNKSVVRPRNLKLSQTEGRQKRFSYQSTPEAIEQAILTKRYITKFKRMVGLE